MKFFPHIIGHRKQLLALENDLSLGTLHHAYLLSGLPHLGKMLIAREFAKLLQCPNSGCGHCPLCIQIEKGYQPDTIAILDDGEALKVDFLRGILKRMNTTTVGKYKILMIQNIERMNAESANTMLKILEDPPQNVVFLLTSSRVEELLPTIVSRLRVVKFGLLPESEIRQLLTGKFTGLGERIDEIVTFAGGKPGLALELAANVELYEQTKKLYDDVRRLIENPDLVDRFTFVADLVKNDGDVENFLQIFAAMAREKLLDPKIPLNALQKERLLKALDFVLESSSMLKRNVNNRLLLENLMLEL